MRELFLGTVQVNRQTRQPGDMAGNGPIRLADSTHKFAELICWLWHDGKLVADRNILKDVSFSRLDEANLCWGADVTIDGMLEGPQQRHRLSTGSNPAGTQPETGAYGPWEEGHPVWP